jgi:hypothetical protein
MRTFVTVCVLMASLGVPVAGAADIDGKWGLGAGVVPGGLKVSLIRGTSERSAWLFDVRVSQQDRSRESSANPADSVVVASLLDQDNWVVSVGPGYRRFLRPNARFSPYWDVEVNGLYSRFNFHAALDQGASFSSVQTAAGVAGRFAFGLEYFFRQHLSVAAHGTVAELAWQHTSRDLSSTVFFTPAFGYSTTGHVVSSSIGLNPVIFLRGYW